MVTPTRILNDVRLPQNVAGSARPHGAHRLTTGARPHPTSLYWDPPNPSSPVCAFDRSGGVCPPCPTLFRDTKEGRGRRYGRKRDKGRK